MLRGAYRLRHLYPHPNTMPATRSSSRSASALAAQEVPPATTARKVTRKRKSEPDAEEAEPEPSLTAALPKVKRARAPAKPKGSTQPSIISDLPHVPCAPRVPIILEPGATVIPAKLCFSFEDAKAHLIAADSHFEYMFANVTCKPFEVLEPLDPFRTLTVSILGQQISWLAARSITHRFLRLFNPSLPETVPTSEEDKITYFPSPDEVASASIESLRTAGLSQRKAEYVRDLAQHFKDGTLSAAKFALWDEEEVSEKLIAVRGIGPWTVHMFSMFSLRRPDVLGSGDLGLQKGLLRWVISSHTGENPTISAKKPLKPKSKKEKKPKASEAVQQQEEEDSQDASAVPAPDASGLPPVPDVLDTGTNGNGETSQAFVDGTVSSDGVKARKPIELPPGMTLATLKARLNGAKVKGNYLTPDEMTFLTHSWRPYRSLGCFYLWSLAEGAD